MLQEYSTEKHKDENTENSTIRRLNILRVLEEERQTRKNDNEILAEIFFPK